MEDGKSKICRVGWEAGDSGKANDSFQVRKLSATEFLLTQGGQSCFIQDFNWLEESHPMEATLLYSKSTVINKKFKKMLISSKTFSQKYPE